MWLRTVFPQGNDDLALHSTNKTIQTMLMKCLGSYALVNSNLFCFFLPSLLRRVLLLADSPLLSLSTETEMKRDGRRHSHLFISQSHICSLNAPLIVSLF